MRIRVILWQHRRDFRAVYECEHCGHKEEDSGYDDDNFHNNVIPEIKCEKCKKKAGDTYIPRQTKYPANFVI